MNASNFILSDYCDRIGYEGTPNADLVSLTRLMRNQLFRVPFENLDVQAGKIVSLEPADIVQKIVYQPRGGYCYEVNGLFAMALASLGIDYFFVGARPMFYPARRPKTHMVVIANIAGKHYLCDCGFGSYGIRAPMDLAEINETVQQDDDSFRLVCEDGKNYVMQALVNGEWVSQYGFDLYPHEMLDFVPANFFNSKHPDAIFVQKLLVVKHDPAGRKILLGNSLKVIENGEARVSEILDGDMAKVLETEFGLIV